jgi:hypothetical protein
MRVAEAERAGVEGGNERIQADQIEEIQKAQTPKKV